MININVLKALANETRLKIIKLLLEHNYCVKALANKLNLTEATISQHLKMLNDAGLVDKEKQGYFTHYYVKKYELINIANEIKKIATITRKECNKEQCLK